MKKIMTMCLMLLLIIGGSVIYAADETAMVTEWTIPANTTITLPVQSSVNIVVDWGDGSELQTITTNFPTHTYTEAGTYDISITGTCAYFGSSYHENHVVPEGTTHYTYTKYLTGLKQWGEIGATRYGFAYCSNLKYVSGDATENSFKNLGDMYYMFPYCTSLTSLDLSKLDTSNVTNMVGAFLGCSSLTEIIFGNNFNTSNVIYMNNLFTGCTSLTNLDLASFDTKNVTSMSYMFMDCESITNIILSKNFDTSNVATMASMFNGCKALESVDVSNFNTANVTDMNAMFAYCEVLKIINVSNFNTEKVTTMAGMFSECKAVEELNCSNFKTPLLNAMGAMFKNCASLKSLDLSGFNTSKVPDMGSLFYGCSSITSIKFGPNFTVENVDKMQSMFRDCSMLTSLDLSSFGESKVTNLYAMFLGCSSLAYLDISNFDTSNVTSMQYMFNGCSTLQSLDLSNFNTSRVTNMGAMFQSCTALVDLDISSFDTSSVTSMTTMFNLCKSIESLDLSSFDTSKVDNTRWMFRHTSKLNSIIISNKFIVNASNKTEMFINATNLNKIISISAAPSGDQFANVSGDIENITFYVPNEAEEAYESAWSASFSKDRIKPIIYFGPRYELLILGEEYEDVDYTVAEYTESELISLGSGDEKLYGFNLAVAGTVNAEAIGDYKITYTLTRTVNDVEVPISEDEKFVRITEKNTLFITEWTIPAGGATITLPLSGTNMEILVDWGDGGEIERIKTNFQTHEYTEANTYDIIISYVAGTDIDWGYQGSSAVTTDSPFYTYSQYLTKLTNWGDIAAIEYGFAHCENLTEISIDVTDNILENVKNMEYMFYNCSKLVNLDLSKWNTENITGMTSMFNNCSSLKSIQVSNGFVVSEDTTNMFSKANSSLRFITVSTEPVANQFKGIITGDIKLYVPNGSLENYKTTLSGDTDLENIKPLLESTDGYNPMIIKGELYNLGNVTVAGFAGVDEADYYEPYGYKLTISGDVDTSKAGKYRLQYILKRVK